MSSITITPAVLNLHAERTYRLADALRKVVQRLDRARDAYVCCNPDCEDRLCTTCEQLVLLIDQAEILQTRVYGDAMAADNRLIGSSEDSDAAA